MAEVAVRNGTKSFGWLGILAKSRILLLFTLSSTALPRELILGDILIMSAPTLKSDLKIKRLALLRGSISLENALEEEHNMLLRLTYWRQRDAFYDSLWNKKAEIEAAVSYHLNLGDVRLCSVAEIGDWIHGSYNMCVPIHIKENTIYRRRRVLIRFPLPYKVGEKSYPGNADEKLRCEAATYIWIQEKCPGVPIPHLIGFSFSNEYCVRFSILNVI